MNEVMKKRPPVPTWNGILTDQTVTSHIIEILTLGKFILSPLVRNYSFFSVQSRYFFGWCRLLCNDCTFTMAYILKDKSNKKQALYRYIP